MDLPTTAVFRDFDFKLPGVEKLMYRNGTSAQEFGPEAHLGQKEPAESAGEGRKAAARRRRSSQLISVGSRTGSAAPSGRSRRSVNSSTR